MCSMVVDFFLAMYASYKRQACYVIAFSCQTMWRFKWVVFPSVIRVCIRTVQVVKLIAYVVVGRAFEISLPQRLLSVADPGITGAGYMSPRKWCRGKSVRVVNVGVSHLRIYFISCVYLHPPMPYWVSCSCENVASYTCELVERVAILLFLPWHHLLLYTPSLWHDFP